MKDMEKPYFSWKPLRDARREKERGFRMELMKERLIALFFVTSIRRIRFFAVARISQAFPKK